MASHIYSARHAIACVGIVGASLLLAEVIVQGFAVMRAVSHVDGTVDVVFFPPGRLARPVARPECSCGGEWQEVFRQLYASPTNASGAGSGLRLMCDSGKTLHFILLARALCF